MNSELSQVFRSLTPGDMAEILLILGLALACILLLQRSVAAFANRLPGRWRLVLLAVTPLLRLLIVVASFLLLVPRIIEPSLQNMIALLGSVGLALGFGLKDYASSLIAGVIAVGERPYRNGDWVEIDGHYGEVTHVGVRTLELVTVDDNRITLPHSRIWSEAIANANNGSPQLMCVVPFYLQPEHDPVAVSRLLQDVALTSPYLCLRLPVSVSIREHPWGTEYRLRAYPLDARQQFRFISELTARGKQELLHAGLRCSATRVDPEPRV